MISFEGCGLPDVMQTPLFRFHGFSDSMAAVSGVKLEPEQIQKIEAEASVIAEIKELGGTV